MKKIVTLILTLASGLLALSAFAQDSKASSETNAPAGSLKIPATEAKKHLNADAIVTGRIAEVNFAERLVRLNFEKPFPNHVFTAVIFAKQTNLFPQVAKLKDRTIEVTGKITDYRGRPEIILTSTNQLKVVEAPAADRQK